MITGTANLEDLLARRHGASEPFFNEEAGRIAQLCRLLAERFLRGGRLLAVGGSPQAWSDAHHIAVEFVHPVIVGKRALPALALAPRDVDAVTRQEDTVVFFEPIRIRAGTESMTFAIPSDDPFVQQELTETLYHVVWELVHVFLDHFASSATGAGQASFLYPFLEQPAEPPEGSLQTILDDVRHSALLKASEVDALRAQTLRDNAETLEGAAAAVRRARDEARTLYAFGNGGSATDAADLVADLRHPHRERQPQAAIDLGSDSAILTALANDIGPDILFARQLIAYGRPGDIAVALSTSGGSANVIEALAEARRRKMTSIAFVGYDGGRIADEQLADHVIVTRSDHIPRIQEAQATAYHALLEIADLEHADR